MRRLLFTIFLIGILIWASTTSSTQSLAKIDAELQAILEKATPTDLIRVIVVFQDKPTEEQIEALTSVHRMKITYKYRIINGVAGEVPAGEIPEIAKYEWIKQIWLDRKVYATTNQSIETSKLIESLQKENEELRQTILNLNQEVAKLQEQIKTQQHRISQLSLNSKMYYIAMFTVGLIVGAVLTSLLSSKRKR